MTTTAQAFLFNADAEGVSGYYGGDFEPPFLLALSAVDPSGAARSTVLLGDVIVSALCTRVAAVSREPSRFSRTEGHDMDLYRTIIWDLADALSGQWHTIDLEQFPLILGRRNVFCITAATLPVEFREGIDVRLSQTNGYLGSVEIDLGNPIQKQLLFDQLIDVAVIADGRVIMVLSWEGTPETTFAGAGQFKPNGELRVAEGELDALKPQIPHPLTYSARGQLSADRYRGKRRYTVHDRVLLALSRAWDQTRDGPPFSFVARSEDKAAVFEANLPEAKFVSYMLNPEHAEGHGKARFFRDELGIGAGDWRYLATAFPAKRDNQAQVSHEKIPIVPSTLTGDARWEAVYQAAHEAGVIAAKTCVPTPMKISGGELIMEGGCGYAHICIRDARKNFARWVVRSGKGNNHYRSGASVHASVASQSYDRAVAYAEAFATVLHLNGIECSVEARYD